MATTLSSNWPLRFKGEPKTEMFIVDTAVAQHIYQGMPLMLDDTGDKTVVINPDLITVAAPDTFVGIAAHEKVVSIGDAMTFEASGIEVYVEPTIVGFKATTYTTADLGMEISMDITGILATTGAGKPRLGKLYKVEDGYCYVQLETPFIQAA